MATRLASLALIFLCFSCATASTVKPYESPERTVHLDDAALMRAVKRNAVAQGWSIVQVDEQRRRLEALSPELEQEGLLTRERWAFSVRQGVVRATMTFEAREAAGPWWHEDVVCDGYEYSRERQQLDNIVHVARHGPTDELVLVSRAEPARR